MTRQDETFDPCFQKRPKVEAACTLELPLQLSVVRVRRRALLDLSLVALLDRRRRRRHRGIAFLDLRLLDLRLVARLDLRQALLQCAELQLFRAFLRVHPFFVAPA